MTQMQVLEKGSRKDRQRQRLFSRRELRACGVRVMQVGSSVELQENRGRYKFVKSPGSSRESTDINTSSIERNEDSIIYIESSCTSDELGAESIYSNSLDATEKHTSASKHLQKVTSMKTRIIKRARKRIKARALTLPSFKSRTTLPPPLDCDQFILSFTSPSPPQHPFEGEDRRKKGVDRKSPISIREEPKMKRLTPLNRLRDRLRPINKRPVPIFSLKKLSRISRKRS